MLRVAYVNQDPGVSPDRPKGAAVHVEVMREALRRTGAEVVPVDCKKPDEVLRALATAGPIDLVYERYALGCDVGALFASQRSIPFALEVNAPLLEEAERHRGLSGGAVERELERRVFLSAQRVLAVSTSVADYVAARGVPRERIWIRRNAVDTQLFRPRSPNDDPSPELFDRDDFVLGFHGRLRPWHGFENLVEVCSRLVTRGLPVRLLVIGSGPFEEVLSGRLPRDRYRLVGWRPHREVARLVRRFDAIALTYPPDAPCYFSPLKLMEAMAVGAVPVVPDLGDLAAIVRDGVSGVVYPPGNWKELEHTIEKLMTGPRLRQTLSSGAVAAARRQSWTAIAREVLGLAGAGVRA